MNTNTLASDEVPLHWADNFGTVLRMALEWRVLSTRVSSSWLQVLYAASGAERNMEKQNKSASKRCLSLNNLGNNSSIVSWTVKH